MTAAELVRYLDRVSDAGLGAWRARCPAHADTKPSLSIASGEGGRVLLRCHAGCSIDRIVQCLGLQLTDLFIEKAGLRVIAAPLVPPVAEWLRTSRGLPASEVERMWAAFTKRGPAVVFRYLNRVGRVLYDKLRLVGGEKVFWRNPSGETSALYGSIPTGSRRVIIVEGELDLHALRAAGIEAVVSVPDGAGSKLPEALLAPLANIANVLIATDADAAGDDLANRLGAALGAAQCRRARFVEGEQIFKDANDALRAGWDRSRFEAAFTAAEAVTATSAEPSRRGPSPDTGPYRLLDSRLCRLRLDRDGNEVAQPLANFDAEVIEEVAYDDGAGTSRVFQVRGTLYDGRELPVARVPAADFAGMGWVTDAWGVPATDGDHRRLHDAGLEPALRRGGEASDRATSNRRTRGQRGHRQHRDFSRCRVASSYRFCYRSRIRK